MDILTSALVPVFIMGSFNPSLMPEPVVSTTTQEEPVVELPISNTCYCVLYLREEFGVPVFGYAGDIHPNTPQEEARVGDVLLTRYISKETGEWIGHASLIVAVYYDTYLIVEANYKKCEAGQREISKYDSAIRGIHRPY